MRIEFDEDLALPPGDVYAYFRTPHDWTRLYGAFGDVRDEGGGWFRVPLRGFPFPLVARVTKDEPQSQVHWTFRGFWKGEGEACFVPTDRGVAVRGYEEIAVRPLFGLSPLFERLFLEKRFRSLWESGWRRLRREEDQSAPTRRSPRRPSEDQPLSSGRPATWRHRSRRPSSRAHRST